MKMKRREFTLNAAASVALTSSALFVPLAAAQDTKPVEGKEYQIWDKRATVEAPTGMAEVIEFFSYLSPVCNAFEPTFHEWTRSPPKRVFVRRVPVSFSPNFDLMQRLYFAINAMNLLDNLHGSIFAAIHVEHCDLTSEATIADWVATQGVSRSKFVTQFNSVTTANNVARANEIASTYSIDRVPQLLAYGRYLTEGSAKGLHVVERLIASIEPTRHFYNSPL